MFFVNGSAYEGERARLYRSPEMIRRDIVDIKSRIDKVDERLNIRSIITEMMEICGEEKGPEAWIPAMAGIVRDAEDTLASLGSLYDSLSKLTVELEDTKWALGM